MEVGRDPGSDANAGPLRLRAPGGAGLRNDLLPAVLVLAPDLYA